MKAFQDGDGYSEDVELRGHLIDSLILTRVFDTIMELGGDFEVLEFRIGKLKSMPSYARIRVKGRSREHLEQMLKEVYACGGVPSGLQPVSLAQAPRDCVLPDGFYSTTNNRTYILFEGEWLEVEGLMMDKCIVVDPVARRAFCKAIRDVKAGDLIVVGEVGVRVVPPERPRESLGVFEFMGSRSSSEKPVPTITARIAKDLFEVKRGGGRIAVVAGPSVVHTGGVEALSELIRLGYVHALLAGNALAVHDVEYALYGTSLGVRIDEGVPTPGGHRNHMSAINEIFKAGSLRDAVEKGILKRGIFYECIRRGIPYALAGSIRDDGPIPDVITDIVEAQKAYKELLKGVNIVLMLATMLHSVAVGNMLPSQVKTIVVDINPGAVTKLLDRGSVQAVGVVSDVGAFLPLLVKYVRELEGAEG